MVSLYRWTVFHCSTFCINKSRQCASHLHHSALKFLAPRRGTLCHHPFSTTPLEIPHQYFGTASKKLLTGTLCSPYPRDIVSRIRGSPQVGYHTQEFKVSLCCLVLCQRRKIQAEREIDFLKNKSGNPRWLVTLNIFALTPSFAFQKNRVKLISRYSGNSEIRLCFSKRASFWRRGEFLRMLSFRDNSRPLWMSFTSKIMASSDVITRDWPMGMITKHYLG